MIAAPRPTTQMAIDRICGNLWPPEFVRRFPEEVTAADEELGLALLGGRARREDDLAEARKLGGSLPLM